MRSLLLALAMICTPAFANDFSIDEYRFSWTVAKNGEAEMRVDKNEEATTVRITKAHSSVMLTPKDAESVGAAMAKTDEYWKKMRGSEQDMSENVDAGAYEVTFRNSTKYGFGVSVHAKEGYSSGVYLDRADAKAFAPHMQKATKLAAFVDEKILP